MTRPAPLAPTNDPFGRITALDSGNQHTSFQALPGTRHVREFLAADH